MIVHYVGNNSRDEGVSFSEKELDFTDISSDITSMLVKSFDTKEPCHFYFESTLALNPIYTFVKTIFEDVSRFQEQSEFRKFLVCEYDVASVITWRKSSFQYLD